MVFKPGQSGNPAGKKPLKKILRSLNGIDPNTVRGLGLVAAIANRTSIPAQTRLTAASTLAMHQEVKAADRIDPALAVLGEPTTAQEALDQMAKIMASATAGRTGAEAAQKLMAMRETFIAAHVGVHVEMEFAAIQEELDRMRAANAKIIEEQSEIIGGLPDLPVREGEPTVIMPKFKRREP
jgi:hypothetical protein